MVDAVSKELTVVGVMEEVTEGTYLAPAAATDYVQPLSDGFSISGTKESIERNILTTGFFKASPRPSQEEVEVTLNLEAKGSGLEGEQTDYHKLLKSMLGGNRQLGARITTETGHTTTVLNIGDADISSLKVGDIVLILEAGAHHISPIVAVDETIAAANITILVPAAVAFSDSVEIAKFQTYFGSNSLADYPTLSVSVYHGNEILDQAAGVRPLSMALTNFSTGQIPTFEFSASGLSFDRTDVSSPFTPVYDNVKPPLVLGACIFIDGERIELNDFSFSIEHETGFITSTCSPTGKISSRKTGKRNITGSMNPYLDDDDVSLFQKFKQNTQYSIFGYAINPSTVTGEYELGSVFSFYLPNCTTTSDVVGDLEGINITEIEFSADGGEAGASPDVFLGFV